jgi:uncharacterized Zn finger protein
MSKRRPHPPRTPVAVAGGIRSQTRRGALARTWWGRRWLAALERRRIGARLGRGRHYASAGQVSELKLRPGELTARVQGAAPEAYRVTVRVRIADRRARERLTPVLRDRPLLLARLLVRDMPRTIETLFREAGAPLFPEDVHDLSTACTCPDWANPCKHVAAVYLLFAEALDRDPALLLALRGLPCDALLGTDAVSVPAAPPAAGRDAPAAAGARRLPDRDAPAAAGARRLPDRDFWGGGRGALLPDALGVAPAASALAAPLAMRLGPLPFWRGQERFLDTVTTVCGRAVAAGWRVWAGEPLPARPASAATPPGVRLRLRRAALRVDLTVR